MEDIKKMVKGECGGIPRVGKKGDIKPANVGRGLGRGRGRGLGRRRGDYSDIIDKIL